MNVKPLKPILITVALILPVFLFAAESLEVSAQHAHGNIKYAYWAFLLGGLSAISLPLGSLLGILWKPSPKITAIFTAFGGGALLAALSIELVAPTVQMVVDNKHVNAAADGTSHAISNMTALIIGSIVGGIFFYILNELLNSKGGYLRKVSTTITHFNHVRYDRYKILLKKLSRISFFRQIPKDHIQQLIQYLKVVHFRVGSEIFQQGEIAGGMYVIEHGELELIKDGQLLKRAKTGDVLGELSMLKHLPCGFTARVVSEVRAFEILNDDFDKIRTQVPEIEKLALQYADQEMNEVSHFVEEKNHVDAKLWSKHAIRELHHSTKLPSPQEIHNAANQSSSAPMAIWLGIFLDGIPESFVIGAGFLMILLANLSIGDPTLTQVIPYTLVAGLFLSNFPEAMSSTIGMKKMGWKTLKVLSLWLSLMIMTAIGSVFGFYFSLSIPETAMIGVEGLAAGAMLTMISQTMIPEAVHIGGNKVVGLATLAGYLAAVAFKIFE